jgi:hypothetical protein
MRLYGREDQLQAKVRGQAMFGFKKESSKAYQAGLEENAVTWQFGYYKFLNDNREKLLLGNADREKSIIAAMTNWMFRFGDYGPKVAEDPSLKTSVENAFDRMKLAFTDENKIAELTLAIIVAAAAQDVPLLIFKSHFDALHKLGLVMKGINIHGLQERLAEEHRDYYYYTLTH